MDYKNLYSKFVIEWKDQQISEGVYTEKHHIVPRHMGGSDDSGNLVVLTYRQHVFAHKLLWKAYGKSSDLIAYLLMSGTDVDKRRVIQKANGIQNVISGHLDKIRDLANTEVRQQKLKILNEKKWSSDGDWYKTVEACKKALTGIPWSESRKRKHSELYKEKFKIQHNLDRIRKTQLKSAKKKKDDSVEFSNFLIVNAERNVEYLTMKSNRSKNLFISPEGLSFESPKFASSYYKQDMDSWIVENWCKREMHGWKRIPKPGSSNITA